MLLEVFGLSCEFSVWLVYYKFGIFYVILECYVCGEVFECFLWVVVVFFGGVCLVVLDVWWLFVVQQYFYDSLFSVLVVYYLWVGEVELEWFICQFVLLLSSSCEVFSLYFIGGVVDVILCDVQGCWLDMGSVFDEVVLVFYIVYFECLVEFDMCQ